MSEQLFLEAFNSEPYFFEKEEKYGAMDIIYTFEDEAGHGFKFHFEKKVALGKHAYVCVLSQKTPGLKTYKRVIGKFSNPMRTVATLLAVVRDIHATRKDVHGIVMSIPEQAFGSYSRLVKKIMTRELRTVLNVEDGDYTPEDFEKMGLVGIVTTVKPRNMNTVYTGPALKEYQERQTGKDGAGISTPTPTAVVPDVKAPAAVKKPDFAAPVEVEFNVQAPDGRTLTLKVGQHSSYSIKDSEGNFVSEKVFKNGDIRFIVTGMREYTNVAKMIPLIQMSLLDGFTVASVPQYRGKVASKGITELNKPDGPVDLPKQTSVAQTMPAGDPVAEKEAFYFDYDHRQITLTFNDKETAGRIKDQLLELGAATFNDNEFFTDKEKLILVDGNALDVKKVQATLFPILGNPLMMNGVFVDPNVRSSVRSPDGVVYHIKGNTIQVEDAPKDSAAKIVGMIIPGVSRIFDDKGNNTIELNAAGIADGHEMFNFVKVLKSISINEELSRYVFMDWDSIAGDAMDKYDLSTSSFKSLATNDGQYLINDSYAGLVAEYTKSAGNVINSVVFKSTYRASDRVTSLFSKDGYKVEHEVGGWGTQITIPLSSEFKLPAHDNLAKLIKELDNLSCFDRNRSIVEYVGGKRSFIAKFMPEDSRVGLRLPTDDAGYLAWRDYTSYATAPNFIRFDGIETLDQFQALVAKVKDFDFGANLLRNIGASKYFADVRAGGPEAKKTYKLKDGGEVEITFEFGDKVFIAFNKDSEGFDKDLSEWADEKNEIFGRISAIQLFKLGTADANKTLKNIDAWLDDHIVSKEDNSSKEIAKSPEALIDQEIESKKSWAEDILRESLSHNTSDQTVAKIEYVGTSRPAKNRVLYVFKLLVQPKFGTPVTQKAFVKGTIELDAITGYSGTGRNRQPMIKPVSITLDRSVTSWVGYDYDPKVADQYEKDMTYIVKSDVVQTKKAKDDNVAHLLVTDKDPAVKAQMSKLNRVYNVRSPLKVGKSFNITFGNFNFFVAPETKAIDEGLRADLSKANIAFEDAPVGAIRFTKTDKLGNVTSLWVNETLSNAKSASGSDMSLGNYVLTKDYNGSTAKTKAMVSTLRNAYDSKATPEEFIQQMNKLGAGVHVWTLQGDERRDALKLKSTSWEKFADLYTGYKHVFESTQLDEGIKEDLTGKAPNRVKRELLEATLQKLGLYRESFSYGNATFKTVMTECAVEIIPTSGNIRNFAKMLGARLGQELRIDDEGFLSFDLDNI